MSVADEIRAEVKKTEQNRTTKYVPFDMELVVENFFSVCVEALKTGKVENKFFSKYITADILVGHPSIVFDVGPYKSALENKASPSHIIAAYCNDQYSTVEAKRRDQIKKELYRNFQNAMLERCKREHINARFERDHRGDRYLHLSLKM